MNNDYLDRYKDAQKAVKPIIILWFKRLYVVAGNAYSWFWLVREMFWRQSASFEDYLLWTFLTTGFYWFISDHDEIFIKPK